VFVCVCVCESTTDHKLTQSAGICVVDRSDFSDVTLTLTLSAKVDGSAQGL